MGLSRSLSTGASAITANQQRFDVISDNIANVSTYGFKSSRANFAEQFSQIYNLGTSPDSSSGTGGTNPYQIGLGVKVGSVTVDTTQGNTESTGRPLDLALQGDGYFVYNVNGQEMYSRAGALTKDEKGYITDSSTGAILQGYNVQTDSSGNIVKDSSGTNVLNRTKADLQISPNVVSPPGQTQNVTVTGNLNSASDTSTTRTTSIDIYDSQGASHSLTMNFNKTGDNTYSMTTYLDNSKTAVNTQTVTFNDDGTLKTPTSFNIAASDLNNALGSKVFDATTPKNISVKLADAGNLSAGLTQYASTSTATAAEQDGYQSGSLKNLTVDKAGKLIGTFTNGEDEVLGQVLLAKFANPAALAKEGNNFLTPTPNSGSPNYGTAVESFPSTSIASGALEQSNVDLTEEFTNMISAQRAFEAASRTVTVSDQLLEVVTSLKR